jgi:hypothetical protein
MQQAVKLAYKLDKEPVFDIDIAGQFLLQILN